MYEPTSIHLNSYISFDYLYPLWQGVDKSVFANIKLDVTKRKNSSYCEISLSQDVIANFFQ